MTTERTVLRSMTAGSFTISEVAYAPGAILGKHAHATARFCAVLAGEYRETHLGRQLHCTTGTTTFRPAGTIHTNEFIRETRCLMIESDAPRGELPGEARAARHGCAFAIATQIQREMSHPDSMSSLIIEGLLLQLIGVHVRAAASAVVPAWLSDVRERAASGTRVSLRGLALSCGMHPSYLATAFRRAFGCSIGEFQRARRIEAAIDGLRRSDLPLAQLALSCGFTDQSHFSRVFKRAIGVTPAAFRRENARTKI